MSGEKIQAFKREFQALCVKYGAEVKSMDKFERDEAGQEQFAGVSYWLEIEGEIVSMGLLTKGLKRAARTLKGEE